MAKRIPIEPDPRARVEIPRSALRAWAAEAAAESVKWANRERILDRADQCIPASFAGTARDALRRICEVLMERTG